LVALRAQLFSLIVDYLDIAGTAVFPSEDHAPLIVDPNRMAPFQSSLQRFEPMARRRSQILKLASSVQVLEFALSGSPEFGRKLSSRSRLQVIEEVIGELISERTDHNGIMLS
jgi:hypothetical protein